MKKVPQISSLVTVALVFLFVCLDINDMHLFAQLRVAAAKNVAQRRWTTTAFAHSAFSTSSLASTSRINPPITTAWGSTTNQHSFPMASRQQSTTTTRRFLSSVSTPVDEAEEHNEVSFFSSEYKDFASLGVQSPILLERLEKLQLVHPTQVQAQAYNDIASGETDITVGAETGMKKN